METRVEDGVPRAMILALSAAVIALAGAALVLLRGTPVEPGQGTIADSAGVRIVTHDDLPPGTPRWTIGPEPSLRIGALDGRGPEVFGGIASVAVRSDGVIIVADHRALELRAFDASGVHLWTAGREGEGPGEFQALLSAAVVPGDSIVAFEGPASRIHVFGPDGSHQRMITLEPPISPDPDEAAFGIAPRASPLGVLADGTLITTPGAAQPLPGVPRPEGRPEFVVAYHSLSGQVRARLPAFPLTPTVLEAGRRQIVRLGPSTRVAADGSRFAAGTQDRFEFEVFDGSGALEMIIRVLMPPVATDLAAYDGGGGAIPRPVSETLPAHGEIMLDTEGRLWVEEYVAPYEERTPAWWVFGEDGRVEATTTLPPDFRPVKIGSDWVLGVRSDEYGVEYVERLEIGR